MLSLNQQTFPQPRPQGGCSHRHAAAIAGGRVGGVRGPVADRAGVAFNRGPSARRWPGAAWPGGFPAARCCCCTPRAGLRKGWRWSRLAAVAYCAAGVLMAVPAISSAVVDARDLAIVRERAADHGARGGDLLPGAGTGEGVVRRLKPPQRFAAESWSCIAWPSSGRTALTRLRAFCEGVAVTL